MHAQWPQHEGVDDSYLKASSYMADSAHEFRLRIKSMMTAKGKMVCCYVHYEDNPLRFA